MIFAKEPTWQKDIVDNIAKEFGIDKRVVREIAYYPLLFLRREMSDEYSERPVRIRKLGAWKMHTRSGKVKRLRERGKFLKENSDKLWNKILTSKLAPFESQKGFENYVDYMVGKRNHNLIRYYERKANEYL